MRRIDVAAVIAAAGWLGFVTTPAAAATTSRVNLSDSGAELAGWSYGASLSADGRYAAFESQAANAVAGDSNDTMDAFVRDVASSRTVRVSVSTEGSQAIGSSGSPAISSDGRYVAFTSDARNLVAGDTTGDGYEDVFLRDRDTDADGILDEPGAVSTTRLSVTTSAGEPNSSSIRPAIGDGRHVAFMSIADNIVPGDTNEEDVFVRDVERSRTVRVSVSTSGQQADDWSWNPSISESGRWVAFTSEASNLVRADSNGHTYDVFVRDRDTDTDGVFDEEGAVRTTRVSVGGILGNSGGQAGRISADGRHVVFISHGTSSAVGTTWDVFSRDLSTNRTTLISASSGGAAGNASSQAPTISADGRYVSFESDASNLVPGDTNGVKDAFVRDRDTDADGILDEPGAVRTARVSVSSTGLEANRDTFAPVVAANGTAVSFASEATNLSETADSNAVMDVFLRSLP
jgi:Tol biopolymer transport system component